MSDVLAEVEFNCATVYKFALRTGRLDDVHHLANTLGIDVEPLLDAVGLLVDRQLLRPEDDGFVPVDPEVAAAILVSPMEREIHERRENIAHIRRRTDMLRTEYIHSAQEQGHGSTCLLQPDELCGFLVSVAETCDSSAYIQLSGQQERGSLEDFLHLSRHLADRSIPVRVVGQHRGRADLAVRTQLNSLVELGADVRTVTYVPRTALVLDRRSAVLLGGDGGAITASRVHHQETVGFLLDMFEHTWDLASPLDCQRNGYDDVVEDLKIALANLMAKGFTDEVLARKLGLSVRTCRRHIAVLMRDLGAVSRFQAGVLAAQNSMVPQSRSAVD